MDTHSVVEKVRSADRNPVESRYLADLFRQEQEKERPLVAKPAAKSPSAALGLLWRVK
jgi:hypothetical protein